MYLPFTSTLLRLLQFSSYSSQDPYQPVLHLPASTPDEHFEPNYGPRDSNNLGNLSPYHDAPNIPGVSVDLPEDCVLDQVILRHGSRGPIREQFNILELVDTLDKAHDIIRAADLPAALQFLKEGYKYHLSPHELTIVGRKELFNHGVEFALRYPSFSADVMVSSIVQRVLDSAYFFGQGFYGLEAKNVTFLTTDDFDDPVPWLRPWISCPNMSHREPKAEKWTATYIPPIVKRLNRLVPGVNLTVNAVRGALYACAYDLAAFNRSPWCDVFTAHELRGLEYELDLSMDGFSGHASRGDPGPLLGAFYIKKLIERLTNATGDAKPLYLEFGHETSILLPLSTMGLNKDVPPLNPTRQPAHRKFRTSDQTPFGASMVWEKFTCKTSFEGPQVRLLLNKATFPLSICGKSEKDKQYGTCSVDEFVRANQYSLNVEYRSEVWDTACGVNDLPAPDFVDV